MGVHHNACSVKRCIWPSALKQLAAMHDWYENISAWYMTGRQAGNVNYPGDEKWSLSMSKKAAEE